MKYYNFIFLIINNTTVFSSLPNLYCLWLFWTNLALLFLLIIFKIKVQIIEPTVNTTKIYNKLNKNPSERFVHIIIIIKKLNNDINDILLFLKKSNRLLEDEYYKI